MHHLKIISDFCRFWKLSHHIFFTLNRSSNHMKIYDFITFLKIENGCRNIVNLNITKISVPIILCTMYKVRYHKQRRYSEHNWSQTAPILRLLWMKLYEIETNSNKKFNTIANHKLIKQHSLYSTNVSTFMIRDWHGPTSMKNYNPTFNRTISHSIWSFREIKVWSLLQPSEPGSRPRWLNYNWNNSVHVAQVGKVSLAQSQNAKVKKNNFIKARIM